MKGSRACAFAALLSLVPAMHGLSRSAAGAPPNVENRLEQLEKTIQALSGESAELKRQLGWDGRSPLDLVEDKGRAAARCGP